MRACGPAGAATLALESVVDVELFAFAAGVIGMPAAHLLWRIVCFSTWWVTRRGAAAAIVPDVRLVIEV